MILVGAANACAMGAKPPVERNCPRSLYVLDGKPCILQLNDENETIKLCPGDLSYPKDLIGTTLNGYNCERDYQDLLISKCKKWRK